MVCDSKIANQARSYNSPESFDKLHSEINQSLLPEILEHIKLLIEIFRQAELVRKSLLKMTSPNLISVAADIQVRLESLIYCGFLSNTGWEQLHHYPRYLKALMLRYERAELNPQAERERSIVWNKWWTKYYQIKDSFEQKELIIEFRWLLEEFHVSLFAQQLGTKKSVSEKRLSAMLEKLI